MVLQLGLVGRGPWAGNIEKTLRSFPDVSHAHRQSREPTRRARRRSDRNPKRDPRRSRPQIHRSGIGRTTVSCQPRDVDRYGRIVAVCFKGNEDLNRWMVTNGWAVAFRRYSLDYVASEAAARQSEINIWSGNFEMPWDWRAQHQNR